MTLSNRTLNRIALLLIGLIALAVGATITLRLAPAATAWTGIPLDRWLSAVPDLSDPILLWMLAAALLVGIALAVAWIATRGRGRTSTAVRADGVVVDDTVVAAILRTELRTCPDVLAVAAQAYRRYGGTVLVRVEARTRVDLPALLAHVRAAVDTADTAIGARIPLVIHVTAGVRTLAARSRITT